MKGFIAALIGFYALSGCASLSKEVDTFPDGKDYNKYVGLSPSELKKQVGEPFSAGWRTDNSGKSYYVVYPQGSSKISTLNVMMSKQLQCRFFYFRPENGYKMKSGHEDSEYTACSALTKQDSAKWTSDESLLNKVN